ncbi:BlaI/MecI/CopY family transcriptional regulator [bacterium]|jgi:BlaI family penicillinase repressor|nr:BlaI/MecI/CopY family transcriptional regulator [bacterium]
MAKQAGNRPAKDKEPSLPDSELEVLRVLWKKERATAREVWAELQDQGSEWTYATVNTLLQRLEAKGLAASDKSRMTYVYWPEISRSQVVKRRVKQLVDKLYDGRGSSLVMHLLKSQRLSGDEVTEIRQLLDDSIGEHDAK